MSFRRLRVKHKQVRTLNFSLRGGAGGGGARPRNNIWFVFDFKNYFIKIMLSVQL
jgi:hypothetical protein